MMASITGPSYSPLAGNNTTCLRDSTQDDFADMSKELGIDTSTNELDQFHNENGEKPRRAHGEVSREWRPGFIERLPWISLTALVLVLSLCAGMLVVLGLSDGQDSSKWCVSTFIFRGKGYTFRPTVSVWLSTMSLIAGKLVGLAFAEAVTLAWWNYAMKGGSLRQMHLNWEAGHSVFVAVRSLISRNFRMFNMICLASIAFAIFSAHEPLMQNASSQRTVYPNRAAAISAELANQLPPGFAGVAAVAGPDTNYLTPDMSHIMKAFNANDPIKLKTSGCGNQSDDATVCTFTLPAVGFNFNCYKDAVETHDPVSKPEFLTSDELASGEVSRTTFDVGFAWDLELDPKHIGNTDPKSGHSNGYWNVQLTVLFKSVASCDANMSRRICTLTPAKVAYPVQINLGAAKLLDPSTPVEFNASSPIKSENAKIDKPLELLSNPLAVFDRANNPAYYHAVGGIMRALQSAMSSSYLYTQRFTVDNSTDPPSVGTGSEQQSKPEGLLADLFVSDKFQRDNNSMLASACEVFFDDPFQYVINNIREIMFRISIAIAEHDIRIPDYLSDDVEDPNAKYWATVTDQNGDLRYAVTQYKTNKWFALSGALVMVLCVAAIVPLFWGFWNLGRQVSLSPIEMAKALHGGTDSASPAEGPRSVFAMAAERGGAENEGSNAQTEDLIDMLGHIRVRYGEVAPQKLGLGPEDTVAPIARGQVYR